MCIFCRGNVFTEPLPNNGRRLSGVGAVYCDEALQRTAGIGPHHDEYNGEMPGNGKGAARRKGTTI
jgi:hypothetical protein